MAQNVKTVNKAFNVDFMRKRSVYIYASYPDRMVICETYLLDSKHGLFEHLIDVAMTRKIPDDIDRVICIVGDGSWFSLLDSLLECDFDGNNIELNYVGSKMPFTPGGRISEMNKVVFKKKVYLMQTRSREKKSENKFTKNNLDDIFKKMGIEIERPEIKKDEKKTEKKEKSEKDKTVSKDKKKKESKKQESNEKEKVPHVTKVNGEPTDRSLPHDFTFDDDGNLGRKRSMITEEWFSTKKEMIPKFEKTEDYAVKYTDSAYVDLIKASPGQHRDDMTAQVNISQDERVFVYNVTTKRMIGYIECVSDVPINVARFKGLTFALVHIGD
jgi:hypothetical protein